MKPMISIVIPSWNPDIRTLSRAINALYTQTLSPEKWEIIIVNNNSSEWPDDTFFQRKEMQNLRLISEPKPGATYARRAGLIQAKADLAILVDDDNILSSEYLENALSLLNTYPEVGACGGRIRLEIRAEEPGWLHNFYELLAARDHGNKRLISKGLRPAGAPHNQYPYFSPLTAGMVLRRATWEAWLSHLDAQPVMRDRCGNSLSSGGDNDAVLAILQAGWEIAYFPELCLTNIIPSFRLAPDYLARLNYECQLGFVAALRRHNACPWSLIPRWTLPLRLFRSWVFYRAWKSDHKYIDWRGQVGRYYGLLKSS